MIVRFDFMKFKLSHAITASAILAVLFAFVCWMSGYNFDSRNEGVGFGAVLGVLLAIAPMAFWFTIHIDK